MPAGEARQQQYVAAGSTTQRLFCRFDLLCLTFTINTTPQTLLLKEGSPIRMVVFQPPPQRGTQLRADGVHRFLTMHSSCVRDGCFIHIAPGSTCCCCCQHATVMPSRSLPSSHAGCYRLLRWRCSPSHPTCTAATLMDTEFKNQLWQQKHTYPESATQTPVLLATMLQQNAA